MTGLHLLPVLIWAAQAPVLIENTGSAIQIHFDCSQEDMETAGLDCPPDQPCPVYLELSGIESVGTKLFLTGNFHTETITLAGLLLESTDGAKSFAEPQGRMHAATLDQIQFLDFQNGWISGWTTGAIPRDPFLFATEDGGKTWRKRYLFEEGKAGSIEQFHFQSSSAGTVLVDTGSGLRHQILETMDGGSNWTMRRESQTPIPFPVPIAPKAWRIRTDSKTRTYILEKQEDERWWPVARFAVAAGECKN